MASSLDLKRVLISDDIDQKCVDILRDNGVQVDNKTKLSKEELLSIIPDYDGLIVRSATKVTADVINAGSRLKIIGRAGTGIDNIDCNAATKKGVVVMNTPGGNTLSAAELTCTMILTVARHIAQGSESLKAGRWDRKVLMGSEVNGKTLAIIGLGRIGKEVALRMQAFCMKTIGFDPILSAEEAKEFGVEWLPLTEIWPQADFITVHVPLIPQTKGMINDAVFAQCKPGVKIINVARGGIVEEAALLRALQSGQCGGTGLDVFNEEPPQNSALLQHPLVTCTPHLGASTEEAQSRVAEDIAEQFVDVMKGRGLFGAVNAQSLSHALNDEASPWVNLGRCLGQLGLQLLGSATAETKVEITTQGGDLVNAGSYLKAAVLVGLLKSVNNNGLNLVSAPALAKDIGLEVSAKHTDSANANNVVQVVFTQTSAATYTVSGTVNGGRPELLQINGAEFQNGAFLVGDAVLYKSNDNPQVMATVAGVLSNADIKILSFTSSLPVLGDIWNLLQVAKSMEKLETIKSHVKWVAQMTF